MRKKVAVLGCTGSVGVRTLNVIRRFPDVLTVSSLCCLKNIESMSRSAAEFGVKVTAFGANAADEAALYDGADVAVIAASGIAGLKFTENAIKRGVPRIALANKESIVSAGALVTNAAKKAGTEIIPVDSEHSAIFQCLSGGDVKAVKRVILTASGGPFLNYPASRLSRVTPADALRHPTYAMGPKISADSATMANKALEVIEARHLFGLELGRIDCLLHPQSIVHSAVEFTDGALIAQLGRPDMETPISFALLYPGRAAEPNGARLDLTERPLTFAPVPPGKFPCFDLGLAAARAGGVAPCVFSAADEAAVSLFLRGRIKFTQIHDIIEGALNKIKGGADAYAETFDGVIKTDAEVKEGIWARFPR